MGHKRGGVAQIPQPHPDDLHRTLVAARRSLEAGYPTVLVSPAIILWLAAEVEAHSGKETYAAEHLGAR